MVLFAEKVFRKLKGNRTFVVITDRTELDTQIYRTFSSCAVATELCQAKNTEQLRELLVRGQQRVDADAGVDDVLVVVARVVPALGRADDGALGAARAGGRGVHQDLVIGMPGGPSPKGKAAVILPPSTFA